MYIVSKKIKELKNKFPALSYKEFRAFWMFEIFSLLGVWIQSASQSWLVYRLTDSAFYLGLVSAIQFTPVLLFSLFAGVIIDNFPKKKVLMTTQYCLAILSLILGILVISGHIRYWHLLIFATVLGTINTVDMPARQSIIGEFVKEKDLMNAVALNSTIFNLARMVGPAIAGIVMQYIGIGFCFVTTSILYIPILVFLYKIEAKHVEKKKINIKSILVDVSQGVKHILSKKILYVMVFLVSLMGIFALNYSVFVPVLARDVLNLEATGYGSLMASLGIGAFLGSLFVGVRSNEGPNIKVIIASSCIVAATLIFSGYATSFVMAAVLLALTGFFNNVFFTNANSMLMLKSSVDFRGRVMSIYTLAFSGTSPIGNLFTGTIIGRWGAGIAFVSCGVVIILSLGIFFCMERYGFMRAKSIQKTGKTQKKYRDQVS